jgi:putative hydrolase of the HAD superfamily
MKHQIPTYSSESEIKKAWNAMILGFEEAKLKQIKKYSEKIPCYLLSNTNEIHAKEFEKSIREAHNGAVLKSYFEAAYYSHEMGLRKPNPEIFQKLIDTHKLDPYRTLFIDDSEQHIDGANLTGLKAYHLKNGETIEQLFGL